MSGKVLILGASGRFGRHAAEAFWNKGWRVKLFDRAEDDLTDAAADVDVIVNALNPPYHHWAKEIPLMTQAVISAARANNATVLIPGNVYGYGKGATELLSSDTPKAATNPLGRIRNEMEQSYRDAEVRTIVLRAGDFIDTEASGNWFDKVIVTGLGKGQVTAPGDPDCAHAWAYLPDLARAAVDLSERRADLDVFEEVLFSGYELSLSELSKMLEVVAGRGLRVKRMNWLPIWLARPFWPLAGGLLEMRYLWSMPHRLDTADMTRLLPNFRTTDPLVALTRAVGHLDIDPDQSMARGTFNVPAE